MKHGLDKVISSLKQNNVLDLSFLYTEEKKSQLAFERKIRRILLESDALLSIYIQSALYSYLRSNSFNFADISDHLDVVLEKASQISVLKSITNAYHRETGAMDAEYHIRDVASSLLCNTLSDSDYYTSDLHDYIIESGAFINKKVTVKSFGSIDGSVSMPNNFDKLIYTFKSTDSAMSFLRQAKPGVYLTAVYLEEVVLKNGNKVREVCNTHFILGITFDGGSGLIISDGNYNPAIRSRTNRDDIQRMDSSFFPYSVLNLHIDGLYLKKNDDSGSNIAAYSGWSHPEFLGYQQMSNIGTDEAIKLSVLLNTLSKLNWTEYLSQFDEISHKKIIKVAPELIDNNSKVIFPIATSEVKIPEIASRESFASAVLASKKKTYGESYKHKHTNMNSYWENVFSSELSKVIITENKLLVDKSKSTGKTLIEIQNNSEMTSTTDIVVNTLKEARQAQADLIKAKVDEYFSENLLNMRKWLRSRASEPDVFESLIEKAVNFKNIEKHSGSSGIGLSHEGSFISLLSMEHGHKIYAFNSGCECSSGGMSTVSQSVIENDYFKCAINGTKANFNFVYRFVDAYAIEAMLNIPLEQMPYHLSQYGVSQYTGNSILDDIDPVEHMSHKFMESAKYGNLLGVSIPMSLSGFNKIRVQLGLAKLSRSELNEIAEDKKLRLF